MDVDLDKINLYAEKGLVKIVKHPKFDLKLINYAPKTQFEGAWDEITLMCRGLIVSSEGKVVARPFPKFFNYDQHSLDEEFFKWSRVITPKMDGSLGILYQTPDDGFSIATRGSFVSEQAIWATNHLKTHYPQWIPPLHATPLFEIIYPENRVVVDYGDMQDLVFLGAINIENGRTERDPMWYGPKAETIRDAAVRAASPPELLKHFNKDDGSEEGFVVLYRHPYDHTIPEVRVKIKYDEYKRLHAIITNFTPRSVWSYLVEGKDFNTLLESVPDEFYRQVNEVMVELTEKFRKLDVQYRRDFVDILEALYPKCSYDLAIDYARKDRKTFADYVIKNYKANTKIMFSLLDNKPIAQTIWNQIKPEPIKPAWMKHYEEE